jgi:hypothetical protein
LCIQIEMVYFDELLTIWQPVIEPVELINGKFKPYELTLDVRT